MRRSAYKNNGCQVTELQVEDTWIYSFSSTSAEPTKKLHKIFYFAGGGFRGVPTKQHWALCAEFSRQLPEYEINLVSYPLVPNTPATEAIPHLECLYRRWEHDAKEEGWTMTLMGDSSGGNIALVLGIYGATRWLADPKTPKCAVESIFAVCPAADLRHQNPEIDTKALKDPLLSRKTIEGVAAGWAGEWSLSDPRISPTLADLAVLQRANIKVDGVLGGYDVLAPEGAQFREKLAEVGVKGDWLVWEKQIHCFVLMFQYHFPEPAAGKDWIIEVLKANLVRSH